MEILEYVTLDGRRPFEQWFNKLDAYAAAKVTIYIARIGEGNFSRVEGVGSGVFECRIDFGPGYRIYFGKDGNEFVILLGGGTKKRQQQDIKQAIVLWQDYKKRKRKD